MSRTYMEFLNEHEDVKAWLKDRPVNTQRAFAEALMRFSETMKVTPEKWRSLDKFKARDLAWQFVQPLTKQHPGVARQLMAALKSWYRNLNGEQLPLDSGRGGKHNIKWTFKKASYEVIPNKEEVYRIVDMAGDLRNKAVLLTLFQSGVRVNALCSLTYGIVKDQLNNDIIMLKITPEIDDKLRGTNIPFYYTFVNGEGAITLKQYCTMYHKDSEDEAPLFYTHSKKPLTKMGVYKLMKRCLTSAGFNPKTMWVHSLRKAFRKIVRKADIDDDDKEQLMGHALRGSRQSYFDRHDVETIREAYLKCNFSREVPASEVTKLRQQLEDEQSKRTMNEAHINDLEKELLTIKQQIKEMLKKS